MQSQHCSKTCFADVLVHLNCMKNCVSTSIWVQFFQHNKHYVRLSQAVWASWMGHFRTYLKQWNLLYKKWSDPLPRTLSLAQLKEIVGSRWREHNEINFHIDKTCFALIMYLLSTWATTLWINVYGQQIKSTSTNRKSVLPGGYITSLNI